LRRDGEGEEGMSNPLREPFPLMTTPPGIRGNNICKLAREL